MSQAHYIQVLTDYQIRFDTQHGHLYLCLDDFVNHIVQSKSTSSYLSKIRDKIKREGLYYKDAQTVVSELCHKLRSTKAKEFYEKWNKVPVDSEDTNETSVTESLPHEPETDTCASFLDIRNNYFQYKGKKVLVIVKDGVAWFKGIDVARLLDYDLSNIHRIYTKIPNENKMTFGTVMIDDAESQTVHNTIFINLAGMYMMVMKSTKSEACHFQSWVCNEVLPSIHRFGSYSIEKKYGCFYDDHDLYEYDACNVCYIAYIGVYDGIPLFKYGITFDYYRREYQEHRKTFDTFQVLYLRQTDNNHLIEGKFTNECKIKDLYIQKEFKGKNRTELFTVNELHSFERMRMIMDKLIEQHPTKEHLNYQKEILQLKQEKEDMSKVYAQNDAYHQSIMTEKNEQIKQLQSHNTSLQNDKTRLYELLESLQKDKNMIYKLVGNLNY